MFASPQLFVYAVSSGTVAPLFWRGSLLDGLWATLIGAFVGLLLVLTERSYLLGKMLLLSAATTSSFLATVIANHVPGTCSFALHFGPITYLLPGWSITTAVIELSTQNMISGMMWMTSPPHQKGSEAVDGMGLQAPPFLRGRSEPHGIRLRLPHAPAVHCVSVGSGTTRMFTALMNAMLLGFGLDVGNRLGGGGDWGRSDACVSVGNWTKVPLFFGTVLSYHVLMKAAPAQWLGMTVVAAISFTLINYTPAFLSNSSASILTSFALCVVRRAAATC